MALGLAVLTGIAEVGHHGGDASGGGAAAGVDHHKKLHQVVVDGGAGGLHQEYVGAADGLVEGQRHLAVGEVGHGHVAQARAHAAADGFRQGPVGISAEDLDILAM